jgi:Tol biopolymer transport system component
MLNHPNVLAVYDVGMHDGAPYLVTELLEGQTLRKELPLPRRKALDYARQVATGLAAAHAKGVTHRDLKPENLLVTSDGRVKILDFGLAKVAAPAVDADAATRTAETTPGVAMGTVGYMSPEQALGKPADHRSDIFSFGAILYEMFSGARAFKAPSGIETLNAILKADPPALEDVALDRLVRRCLEKSPEQRFQSAADLAFNLETLTGSSNTAPSVVAAVPRARLAMAVACLAVMGTCVAAGHFLWRRPAAEPPLYRWLTFDRGYLWSARFTPDGQSVIYGAAWKGNPLQLFSLRLGSLDSRALGLPSADILSISSSGEMAISIGRHYTRGWTNTGTLARVALDGQAPREILEDVQEADWAPDGQSLAVVRSVSGRQRLEYPAGTVLYETSGWISYPRVSPDGQKVAYLDHAFLGDDRGSVAIVAMADRSGKKTTLSEEFPASHGLAWSPGGGEIWFSAVGSLAGAGNAYDLHAVSMAGKHRLVARVPADLRLLDIARDGRVLLSRDEHDLEMAGRGSGESKERDFSWLDYSMLADVSPDGSRILFSEMGSAAGSALDSIFLRRTDGSPPVRLGEGRADALSPDGKWAVAMLLTSPSQLIVLPTGPGEPKRLSRDSLDYQRAWWFPDGKRLLVAGSEPGHAVRIFVRDLEGGKLRPVTPEKMEVNPGQSILSPDGHWVAAGESGKKAYLYPVESTAGEPRPIPGINDNEAPIQWSADGHSVYVRRLDEVPARIYRLDLSTGRRELWKQIMPDNPTGVVQIRGVLPSRDGRAYAYNYLRILSGLYVAEGLK